VWYIRSINRRLDACSSSRGVLLGELDSSLELRLAAPHTVSCLRTRCSVTRRWRQWRGEYQHRRLYSDAPYIRTYRYRRILASAYTALHLMHIILRRLSERPLVLLQQTLRQIPDDSWNGEWWRKSEKDGDTEDGWRASWPSSQRMSASSVFTITDIALLFNARLYSPRCAARSRIKKRTTIIINQESPELACLLAWQHVRMCTCRRYALLSRIELWRKIKHIL